MPKFVRHVLPPTLVLALVCGCSRPKSAVVQTKGPVTTIKILADRGGVARSRDGVLRITIGAGELQYDASISIHQDVASPNADAAIGNTYLVAAAPASAVPAFGFEAELQFAVDPTAVPNIGASALRVASGEQVGDVIDELWGGTYNTDESTFRTIVTRLGYFVVVNSAVFGGCNCNVSPVCDWNCVCDPQCGSDDDIVGSDTDTSPSDNDVFGDQDTGFGDTDFGDSGGFGDFDSGDSDTTGNCPPQPTTWTCPGYYCQGDGCDCGCGAIDPDCAPGQGCAAAMCNGAALGCEYCYNNALCN